MIQGKGTRIYGWLVALCAVEGSPRASDAERGKNWGLLFLSLGGAVHKAKYGPVFEVLMPHMPDIVFSYSTLAKANLNEAYGEYVVKREIDGKNCLYFIYFLRDPDGVRRIDEM